MIDEKPLQEQQEEAKMPGILMSKKSDFKLVKEKKPDLSTLQAAPTRSQLLEENIQVIVPNAADYKKPMQFKDLEDSEMSHDDDSVMYEDRQRFKKF